MAKRNIPTNDAERHEELQHLLRRQIYELDNIERNTRGLWTLGLLAVVAVALAFLGMLVLAVLSSG